MMDNSPLASEAPHGTRDIATRAVVDCGGVPWRDSYGCVRGAAGARRSTGVGLWQLVESLRGGHTLIKVDQPTVVQQIQQLQRLETVSYTMDKIISGEHENAYLPQFLAGDRLLLVVHGEVVGGINLAGLQPGDVILQGQKALVHLPAAEILEHEN